MQHRSLPSVEQAGSATPRDRREDLSVGIENGNLHRFSGPLGTVPLARGQVNLGNDRLGIICQPHRPLLRTVLLNELTAEPGTGSSIPRCLWLYSQRSREDSTTLNRGKGSKQVRNSTDVSLTCLASRPQPCNGYQEKTLLCDACTRPVEEKKESAEFDTAPQ
jgi:hypothetical protein